ncbi:hypothetical protein SFC07_04095 [Corynebacterium callunae]|uniref:hypothetical protein n=1 Tax=Corynebacterium callunae TaxID=1721 RepID=UPI0039820F12
MSGTGVREIGGEGNAFALPNLSGMSRAERITALRSRMSAMGVAVPQIADSSAPEAVEYFDKENILAAPDSVSQFLPGGGLPRRALSHITEVPLLIVAFLAHVTAQGGHAAVIGWKDLAYAGVIDLGGVCENIIAIPEPGTEPLNVAAVLCEGLDLVVYKGPEIQLSPTRARPLLAKLRKGSAALLMVGTQVASPALVMEAETSNYLGIGQGRGRIRGVELKFRATAKGQPPRSGMITISRAEDAALLHTPPTLRVVP